MSQPQPGATVVALAARDRLEVLGPDTFGFLHSILSADVDGLGDGEGVPALLLSPQGKLEVLLRVLRVDAARALLDTEPGYGARLAELLQRYRIRMAAELGPVDPATAVLAVRGDGAASLVATALEVPVPAPPSGRGAARDLEVVRAPWPGTDGVDVFGPVPALEVARDALVADGAVALDVAGFDAARITAGIPRLGRDVDERTIAQEAFLERDAVSFTKGCFVGQELVCRIDSRGHVNRFLRLFVPGRDETGAAARPPVGAEVVAGAKVVGALTSVTEAPHELRALGYLRREVDIPAEVRLRWPGGERAAVAEALPGR